VINQDDPNLLVGLEDSGDAGVYAIDEHRALVQTVDILTPIADDPHIFGEIAAANSMSDVYAMGGKPVTVLNILGLPRKLGTAIARGILEGGCAKVREAGAVVVGGHSILDEELKYGLAVTGMVDRDRIVTNGGALSGDRLILTKPLGTGVISTAMKGGVASDEAVAAINELMRRLNGPASAAMVRVGVSACTDVTGFGLLGHLHEMAEASGVAIRVQSGLVPILPEAREYAEMDLFPGGSRANYQYMMRFATYDNGISEEERMLLCDAQTSGGLLISVPAHSLTVLEGELKKEGVDGVMIGEVIEGPAGHIRVVS
jgi:selenide,water dikinase